MKNDGSPASEKDYMPYPEAFARLHDRLNATPEELAAWIFMGYMRPRTGGIAAYVNAIELDRPSLFRFRTGEWSNPGEDHDYVAAMMACWFRTDDIERFQPTERFMVGSDLIARWSKVSGISAAAYIQAKIRESRLVEIHPVHGKIFEPRLVDIHPVYGGTLASYPEEVGYPPIDRGLFRVSDIERIEAEDCVPLPSPGSNLGLQLMAVGTAKSTTRAGGERADLLAPVIADAVAQAGDNRARVFALLREWAKEKRPPLLGVTDFGLQWVDANDCTRELSSKSLGERLRRQRDKAR